jgi:hypothetical protein
VEHGKVRWDFPFCHHILTFEAAFFAKAHWADVAAAITFNAFFKFGSPKLESLLGAFFFPLHRSGVLWFNLLAFQPLVRIR